MIWALLILFQLKHFIADYPMQNAYMLGKFKRGYGWIAPLLSHVAVHGFFTALIVAYFKPELIVPLTLMDMAFHFAMDRVKASPDLLGRFKGMSGDEYLMYSMELNHPDTTFFRKAEIQAKFRGNQLFWWCLGIDQMVHHLTHYIIIYILCQ